MIPARDPLCTTCLTSLPREHRFCPGCGGERHSPAPARRRYSELQDRKKARLTVLRGADLDGASFFLSHERQSVGRKGDVRLEDPFLAPIHATLAYVDGALFVTPAPSPNGVLRRIRGATEVRVGDTFLAGESLFEIIAPRPALRDATGDGTVPLGSPIREHAFGVRVVLVGGAPGAECFARRTALTIGQEGNDVNLPGDPFLARAHCAIETEGENLILVDLDSDNGTFVRFQERREVVHGDYLVMGRCVLRVEFSV